MQVQRSKKTKSPEITISNNRRILFVLTIIFIVSLLILTHKYFLNDQNVVQKQSNKLLNSQGQSLSPGVIIGNGKQSDREGNDVYFGPIKLKNSGYIGDSLDTFVQEHTPSPSPASTDEVKFGNEKRVDVSLTEFLHHPISSVSELSTTFITDYTNNGRKTTLIKLVDAVSRYYVTYERFPITGQEASYDWVDEMVDNKEMSGVYSYILEKTSPVSKCGSAEQTGYCYDSDEKEAIIYVKINEYSESATCGDTPLFLLWSSSDNRLGQVCLEGSPSSFSGFSYLKEK